MASQKEVEALMKGEFNRSYNYYGDISVIGAVELENQYKLKGGIAIGTSASNTDYNTFLNIKYSPFSDLPISFSASYIHNSLPEYRFRMNSIFPFVSYNTKYAGISVGSSFRFSSFYDEKPHFESIFSFHTYYNYITTDTLIMGVSLGTFNDFMARNMGAYSLCFNAIIFLNNSWSIFNEVEIMQSGGDGLSTIFYGFSWKGGVRFTWRKDETINSQHE